MRKRNNTINLLSWIPVIALLALSCEEMDDIAPTVFNIASIETDHSGNFCRIKDDYGKVLTIIEDMAEQEGLTADSTYRMICSYVEYGDTAATLYSASAIISCTARPLSYFDGHEILKDPLEVQSYWVSGGYLNIILEIKGLNKSHALCPIDYSTASEVIFGFYHDQNSDVMGYTKNAYVSIPLWPYTFLCTGDEIKFSVIGYDGEEKTYSINCR